jgi:hypothetical protein
VSPFHVLLAEEGPLERTERRGIDQLVDEEMVADERFVSIDPVGILRPDRECPDEQPG